MVIYPLSIVIRGRDEAGIVKALSRFSCDKDSDVKNFLVQKSISHEKENLTRTYLCFDKIDGLTDLVGFYSIAVKPFFFNQEISKRKRRIVAHSPSDFVPAFLIGQLARSDKAPKGIGAFLLNSAIASIKVAQRHVGGVFVYLDCKEELVPYYMGHGFKELQFQNGYHQLYLHI